LYLNAAPNQYACTLENMFCTISCIDNEVYWHAHTCNGESRCPPYDKDHWSTFYNNNPKAKKMAKMGILKPAKQPISYSYEVEPLPNFNEQPIPQNVKSFTKYEKEFSKRLKASYSDLDKEFLKKYGFNLRGAECEILDDKEVCFVSHRGGRFVYFISIIITIVIIIYYNYFLFY